MHYGNGNERGPDKDEPNRLDSGIFLDCKGARQFEVRPRVDIPERKKEDAMLVLSRKLNEKIVIDGGIVVTVVKIDRNQIRLGIEAPSHVRVFREEIAGTTRRAAVSEAVAAGV
jgi:carbon storage regulator